ncbi:MAG: putative S-adenosylmethionine-dependent methyltransferase [Chloroflexi bacterium ADurb.Bin325]|nr:MAG: putative S-adenosylmethionine-dependent methyltransferase [Chloroflexi bacterium ADurb.Bin325]
MDQSRAICDYEGTSYRARFWEGQGREYEDLAERIALRRLLPPRGQRILEIGAGFGRLADLYAGYEQVILLDYAKSGLREAQQRLGASGKFVYVAADLYRLPLASGVCDTIVTVRVLHHLMDVPAGLRGIHDALRPGGAYVLEYANKRNLKAVARYLLRRQSWSPFSGEPYEFADLNFDFHPRWMAARLADAGFAVEEGLAVSHFRAALFKRLIPPRLLAAADGALQRVGAAWKLTPSVFLRARARGAAPSAGRPAGLFACPACRSDRLEEQGATLVCRGCSAAWGIDDGIYDFKTPVEPGARWRMELGQTGN